MSSHCDDCQAAFSDGQMPSTWYHGGHVSYLCARCYDAAAARWKRQPANLTPEESPMNALLALLAPLALAWLKELLAGRRLFTIGTAPAVDPVHYAATDTQSVHAVLARLQQEIDALAKE